MDLASMYMIMTEMTLILCVCLLVGMVYLYFVLVRMIEAYNNFVEVQNECEKIDIKQL